jgi:hypothetical protein
VKSERNEGQLPPLLPPKRSAELSAWKNFGDLIEIGQTSQRCIVRSTTTERSLLQLVLADSRLPPDVEIANIRSAFTAMTRHRDNTLVARTAGLVDFNPENDVAFVPRAETCTMRRHADRKK